MASIRSTSFIPALGCLTCLILSGCGALPGPPYEPPEALDTFEIADGYQVELFASEPLISDPVAMAIDEFGRVYVVEMPGYPLDTRGSGRVKMLHDSDDDGMPDRATVFADQLRLPTGLMRWKNGILVTDPPDLIYFEDSNDDGYADIRQPILTGFALSNPQHNANTPVYGLDNWIYIANNGTISWTEKYADPFGDRGKEIRFVGRDDTPVLPRNGGDRNIRLRPDSFELEILSARSQFGHTFDSWGRHFLNDNSHHHYYEAIAARYFAAKPEAGAAHAVQTSSDHGDASAVFPITVNPKHQLLTDRGVFTSACGLLYYLGGLFRVPDGAGITFTAEPVHNLVHADKVSPVGAGFTAERAYEGREFLASRDSWFRPVSFTVAPDGALYVVDYYREIVEHPEWMDDATVESGDLNLGTDRGRIYRITPEGTPPAQWLQAIDTMHTAERVSRLADPNIWWRRTAQRLLLDTRDPATTSLVRRLLEGDSGPLARVHALWTLDGLGTLQSEDIRRALSDPNPGVRENALVLSELHSNAWDDLIPSIIALADDPEPRVRFQAMLTLGLADMSNKRNAQRRILERDLSDELVQAGALLSMPTKDVLQVSLRNPAHGEFVVKVSEDMARAGTQAELLRQIATAPSDAWWHVHALRGMIHSGSDLVPPDLLPSLLRRFWETDDQDVALAIAAILPQSALLDPTVDQIRSVLSDISQSVENQIRAIRLLVRSEADTELLTSLLSKDQPLEVQMEVIAGLRESGAISAAQAVLDQWSVLTPRLRFSAWGVFRSQESATLLVQAIEDGIIEESELPWSMRVRLMRDTQEPTRSRARAQLQIEDVGEGVQALPESGDATRGEVLYSAACATCHENAAFGPDLATVAHWPRMMLAHAIAEPNQSISSGYELWEVTTAAGDTLQGIIGLETPNAINLVQQQRSRTVLRTDLTSMRQLSVSAMPTNLLPDAQSMADIISYLQQNESDYP